MRPVPVTCPHCGRVNNMHAEPGLAAPTHGDVGICWDCHEPYKFVLSGVALTPDERAEVERDADYRRTRAAMAESHTAAEANALRRNLGSN